MLVSGLAVNFMRSPEQAVVEFARFWDAAGVPELDEGRRFPLCRPDALRDLRAEPDGTVRLTARAWAVRGEA